MNGENQGEKGQGNLPQSLTNPELLESYLGKRKLSESSREYYEKSLKCWEDLAKIPLLQATQSVLSTWFAKADAEYAASTIAQYQLYLRHLHTYGLMLTGLPKKTAKGRTDELFEVVPVKDLRRQANKDNEMRDKLITPGEFKSIMRAAKHPRVQAILSVLYDSACRKGEIFDLKLRNVEFREDHVLIRVKGKTGERTVPLLGSLPYLKQWLMVHPDRGNLEAPLFCTTLKGKIGKMHPSTLNASLARLCKTAGVRHLYPHMIRHSRLTDLAEAGLGEFGLKDLAGWTPASKMAAKYVHLSGKSHVDKVLQLQGVEVEAPQRNGLTQLIEIVHCPQCDAEVGTNMTFCPGCGFVLDEKLRLEKAGELERIKAANEELKQLWNETLATQTEERKQFDERLDQQDKEIKRLSELVERAFKQKLTVP